MSREITQIITGREASDGAGVKLTRVFGGHQPQQYDPFLLLDEFGSDQANDYIAGFPDHPHRGFETVTYMLEGCMLHQDHLGHEGLLKSGDVQWMTAGRGIIHSEMPQQQEGRLRGFQLWLNLPKLEKMKAAAYRDIPSSQIPIRDINGIRYKLIAGEQTINGEKIQGAITGLTTQPLYLDIHFLEKAETTLKIPDGHTTLLYLYEGSAAIGSLKHELKKGQMAQTGTEGKLIIDALPDSRLLVLAGKPLNEPIAQYGPFVMNTSQEINQAIEDYRNGKLTD